MNQEVVIIGAGGHSKVVADIVLKNNDCLIGFLDDNIQIGTEIVEGYIVLDKISGCLHMQEEKKELLFNIAIGDNYTREKIANTYRLKYYTAIHPTANIAIGTKVGEGTSVMANACINTNATVGKHCIINTGAIIEHDNFIGDYVHISPNAALGGSVKVGKCSHIGIGATVKNNINIAPDIIVGAGAAAVKNIRDKGNYIGVPAKKQNK